MCGILGWIRKASELSDKEARGFDGALAALAPRGPDGRGIERGHSWLFGHTRLTIVDLSDAGKQPMTDGRGNWLTFNGEIYNYIEIRAELKNKGVEFLSTSDSEVLLHSLRVWGIDAIKRFRGMFAFAYYNTKEDKIILVRDRIGVKPLVYSLSEQGELRFASTIKALEVLPGARCERCEEGAYLYMSLGYIPAPHTVYKGIEKLKPGHFLEIEFSSNGNIKKRELPYWSISDIPEASAQNESVENYLEQLAHLTSESIDLRLRGDVEVATLLSGGIDSSIITALAASKTGNKIKSFTMGFDDKEIDESQHAINVAKEINVPIERFEVSKDNVLSVWNQVFDAFDEPFADASAVPTLLLCQLVSKHFKVALSGDGGDESHMGYQWHRAMLRADMSWPMRRIAACALRLLGRPGGRVKADILSQNTRLGRWITLRSILPPERRKFLPVAGAERISALDDYYQGHSDQVSHCEHPLDWSTRMDMLTYLPDDIMAKVDRASMSTGLELREPLLDHKLIEAALTFPVNARYSFSEKRGKSLLRKYLCDFVPLSMIDRPKQGFMPPFQRWAAFDLKSEMKQAVAALESGELAPLMLPEQASSWEACLKLLDDPFNGYPWKLLCYWKWTQSKAHR